MTHTQAALLRNHDGIATRVKNSCCVAASIIAPSSSTEAFIPHEKLREASTPSATLTAQNRPLPQLAEGYKHLSLEVA
ncbi:hypothetical protein NZ35_12105 [Pseudomonas chlororaphis]|uniref:Uncharacterized protein n=1 Tax=Pseudomonas chlororaphis TaxID=587753 RepID=A0A0A6DF00_9PSED|nr:hypothetical protein NZ35_12105 [Pseudomonas chlororaphis]